MTKINFVQFKRVLVLHGKLWGWGLGLSSLVYTNGDWSIWRRIRHFPLRTDKSPLISQRLFCHQSFNSFYNAYITVCNVKSIKKTPFNLPQFVPHFSHLIFKLTFTILLYALFTISILRHLLRSFDVIKI